jgi:hypothetical protein
LLHFHADTNGRGLDLILLVKALRRAGAAY